MDAHLEITRPWTRPQVALGSASLSLALATLLALLLPLVAAVMLARRLAGALVAPADAVLLAAAGLVGSAAAVAIHLAMRRLRTMPGGASLARAGDVAADVSLVALAVALSLPGSSPPGIVAMWLAVVAEVAWWQTARSGRAWQSSEASNRHEAVQIRRLFSDAPTGDEAWAHYDSAGDALTQSLNYHRTAQGHAAVSGWLSTTFEPAQRTAFVHLAFCPAFDRPPRVEAEPLDGPSCRIRPTLVLPWGVRWEVKLDDPAEEPATVVLGFTATEEELRPA